MVTGVTQRALTRVPWLLATVASAALVFALAFPLLDRGSVYFASDSHAYWAADLDHLYTVHAPEHDAFLYSPAAGQVADLFGEVDWPVFREGWRAMQAVTLIAITGPFAGVAALTLPLQHELLVGNISIFMAAAILLGFRWPAMWAFMLLTKVTPGVGVIWFAARREWRSLGIALGATAAIVIVSFVLAPSLWFDWVRFLSAESETPRNLPSLPPLAVRLPAAVLLIVAGARIDARWVVPIAVFLAHGHPWISTMSVMIACIPLALAAMATYREQPAKTNANKTWARRVVARVGRGSRGDA